MKTPRQGGLGVASHDTQLLSTRDLASRIPSLTNGTSEITAIQKYIKPKGPKAFIVRAVWRKNKPAYSWVITNKENFTEGQNIDQA